MIKLAKIGVPYHAAVCFFFLFFCEHPKSEAKTKRREGFFHLDKLQLNATKMNSSKNGLQLKKKKQETLTYENNSLAAVAAAAAIERPL